MERLRQFRKINGLTQDNLGDYLGIKKSFLSRIEGGKEKMPADKFRKLLNNDKGWDTSMLIEDSRENLEIQEKFKNNSRKVQEKFLNLDEYYVPVLPTSAHGGSLQDYSISVQPSDCEYAISPIAGADMIIPVLGESMAPEYGNGSRVIVKKVNDKAFIEWGRVYVLDTVNGPVIKEIRKGDNEDELLCVSLNPDPKYAPFSVRREDILGVYRVLMCMALK